MTNAILICLPALVIVLGYVALLTFEKMHPVPAASGSGESGLLPPGDFPLILSAPGDQRGKFASDELIDIFEEMSALVADKKRQRRSGG
jgi:hypothetical protein